MSVQGVRTSNRLQPKPKGFYSDLIKKIQKRSQENLDRVALEKLSLAENNSSVEIAAVVSEELVSPDSGELVNISIDIRDSSSESELEAGCLSDSSVSSIEEFVEFKMAEQVFVQPIGNLPQYNPDEMGSKEFLKRFERYCDANQITTDARKKAVAVMCMKGAAESWLYREMEDADEPGTWEEFKQALTARFELPGQDIAALQLLETIKQKDGESVEDYADRFKKVAQQIKDATLFPARAKIAKFLTNLHYEIKNRMSSRSVGADSTMESVIMEAKVQESHLKEYWDEKKKQRERRSNDSSKRNDNSHNNNNYDRRRNQYGGRNGNSPAPTPSGGGNNTNSERKDISEVTCYSCNQRGHYSTKCPNRANNTNASSSATASITVKKEAAAKAIHQESEEVRESVESTENVVVETVEDTVLKVFNPTIVDCVDDDKFSLDVMIGDCLKMKGLPDSGAGVTLISKAVFDMVIKTTKCVLKKSSFSLKGYDGSSAGVTGECEMSIVPFIGIGRDVVVTVQVVKTCPSNIILGRDWMKAAGAKMDFEKNTISFPSRRDTTSGSTVKEVVKAPTVVVQPVEFKDQALPSNTTVTTETEPVVKQEANKTTGAIPKAAWVRPKRAVNIPPGTIKTIEVSVDEMDVNVVQGSCIKSYVLEPFKRKHGIIARVHVNKTDCGSFTTTVMNCGTKAIHIAANAAIGKLEAVEGIIAEYDSSGELVGKDEQDGRQRTIDPNKHVCTVKKEEEEDEIESFTAQTSGDSSITDEMILARVGDGITEEQKAQVLQLLRKYESLIAKDPKKPSFTSKVEHHIDTGDALPIKQKPYRTSQKEEQVIAAEVKAMCDNGVAQPSNSPWASPVVLVVKKDGSIRFCVDYRKVNAITRKDCYPLPRIAEVLDMLGKAKFFSSIDFASGYWQIPMAEADVAKTAFVTRQGLFEFTRMPFGLTNAPSTFQRAMDVMLSGLNWVSCLVYLDDVMIFSDTFENHLKHLEAVFQRMVDSEFQLKLSKCSFVKPEVEYLGHIISASGVKPDPKKVEKVKFFPVPKNVTDIRSFVGLCSYYRRFVADFAKIAKPMFELTKKGVKFEMNPAAISAFEQLKGKLIEAPVLRYPDFKKPFTIYCDASNIALGAVLAQMDADEKDYVIAYDSRVLSKEERRYSVTERECLAVLYAIKQFRPYIHGTAFTVVTDHGSLQWLKTLRDPDGRLARWALKLQGLDMKIIHRPGERHGNADALSRAVPETEETTEKKVGKVCHVYQFVPKHEWKYMTRADEAKVCNVGASNNKVKLKKKGKVVQPVADTAAADVSSSSSSSSSNLGWRTGTVLPNNAAVNSGASVSAQQTTVVQATSETEFMGKVKAGQRSDENTAGIISYLEKKELPLDVLRAERLRAKASSFMLGDNGLLYHIWQPTAVQQKMDVRKQLVIPKTMKYDVMVQHHESYVGGHFGAQRTYEAVRERYWWDGMYADIERYCKACEVCSRRKTPHRQQQAMLGTLVIGRYPFERMGIDCVGPLPESINGNKYIVVITDSFTRYPEAWAVADIKEETIAQLLVEEICCRYGCPKYLHSDRGSNFLSALCMKVYDLLQIHKTTTTAYHPQANAHVERFNGVLVGILAMYAGESKDWDAYVPYALAAYRSTMNATTGYSPHYLLFGREMVMPTDILNGVDIDSLNYSVNELTDYADEMEYRFKRAHDNVQAKHTAVAKQRAAANAMIKHPKQFAVGDLVMVQMPGDVQNKLSWPYRGPYAVLERISNVNYKIDFPSTDGVRPYSTVHVDRLKSYKALPDQQ